MFQEFLENQNLLIGALISGSIATVLIISGSIVKLAEMEVSKREKVIFFLLGFFMVISIGVAVAIGIYERWFTILIPILIFMGLAITSGIKVLSIQRISSIAILISGELTGAVIFLLTFLNLNL